MSNSIKFSIADAINVIIITDGMSSSCKNFLTMTYRYFEAWLEKPMHTIKVKIEDQIVTETKLPLTLGKDAYYCSGEILFSTGHYYKRSSKLSTIMIPSKVKRGRIKFKRNTPGRHITDEILEPYIINILSELKISTIHASSYLNETGEHCIVKTAWRGTGKTEAILPLVSTGRLLSDDLTLINFNTKIVYSYPRPIRVYKYNLKSLPKDAMKSEYILKSYLTPPWRPVLYLPIKPRKHSTLLSRLVFLNDKDISESKLKKTLVAVMDFETSHFQLHKSGLIISDIISPAPNQLEI